MTPIWVPLVVALLGIGGILLTQRRADRREDARWQREREREQALWAREDAARSYEHRRAAYADFIKEWHRLLDEYHLEESAEERFAPRYLVPLRDCLVQIQIFGTHEAAKLAGEAVNVLWDATVSNDDLDSGALTLLQSEIRRDLSIPDDPPRA